MNERGQASVFAVGLLFVCFAVAGLATDATRAFIARQSLQNLADSAALAGASEMNVGAYYSSGGTRLETKRNGAKATVAFWLHKRGFDGPREIGVDQNTVFVALETRIPTLFLRLIGVTSMTVRADADAALTPGSVPGG